MKMEMKYTMMEEKGLFLICENCRREFTPEIDDNSSDEYCSMLCLIQSMKKGLSNL